MPKRLGQLVHFVINTVLQLVTPELGHCASNEGRHVHAAGAWAKGAVLLVSTERRRKHRSLWAFVVKWFPPLERAVSAAAVAEGEAFSSPVNRPP